MQLVALKNPNHDNLTIITPKSDKKCNAEVLKKDNSQRKLDTGIRRKKSIFFSMVREKPEYVVVMRMLKRKRERIRQREDATQFDIMAWRNICVKND